MVDMKRQYRTGSLRLKGKVWYIRYYDAAGERHEEAAGKNEAAAKKLLRQRTGEVASGAARKAGGDITIGDCLDAVLADYAQRGKDCSIPGDRIRAHVRPALGHLRAAAFSRADVWAYVEARRGDKVKDSTINRELALVRRALNIAADDELIARAPRVPMLDEGDNVRRGFLTPAEYRKLMDVLPDYLQPLVCCAYYTGLRRGTLLALTLDQVDLDAGLIWVSRIQTKNRTSQTAPIVAGEMRRFCEVAVAANNRFLFERDGCQIRSFKSAWAVARIEAGLLTLKFHDLRRTAVRDWKAAGADEGAIMAMTGHKTRSMFDRYDITGAAEMQRVAKLRGGEAPQVKNELGANWGKAENAKPS